MSKLISALLCAVLALAGGAALAGPADTAAVNTAAGAAVPVADFFAYEKFSNALLSPDGRYIAIRVTPPSGRMRLVTMELATQKIAVAASFDDADIGNFYWVNDRRLVYSVVDRETGVGDTLYGPGLYAVDRDGTRFRQLVNRSNHFFRSDRTDELLLDWNTSFRSVIGDQRSDFIYVLQAKGRGPGALDYVRLLKLNTVTGHSTGVKAPDGAVTWGIDQAGEPRIVIAKDEGKRIVYTRDAAPGSDWKKLLDYDAYTGVGERFSPAFFGPDGTFYVRTRAKGNDKQALYTYDLTSGKLSDKPVFSLADYDFAGVPIIGGNKLLGIYYVGESPSVWWYDEKMKALQKTIDARLPGLINHLSVGRRSETPFVLITSWSDVQPLTTMLYNTETDQLTMLGESRPQIHAAQMSEMNLVHYPARDGLNIPAWLTLPKGHPGKNLPLVVLVHGGPYVRGEIWEWNREVQFLASRGYAVLQPDYRGTTGYGYKLFRAGWKQWGLKMQDDIADGAKWAIAQGIADPARICIAGASYGGYAVLMGLVNDPGLYKCGIDWAGVTDINLLYDGSWTYASDMSDEYKQYGMPTLVGDQVKDAAQLKATSPIEQAGRIRQPLLLAYGGSDLRVPLYHGKKFYSAIKDTNPNVEWVVYDEEGHGWALPKNNVDFWSRVEKFLDKNIGH